MALCHLVPRHIARLGVVCLLTGCLLPGPSMAARGRTTTETPTLSGLPPGVTRGGVWLSTMAAALVSASESAPDVAQVASLAFPNLGPNGLRAATIFEKDWHNVSLVARKQSDKVIRQLFERDLHGRKLQLEYIRKVSAAFANETRNWKAGEDRGWWFFNPWALDEAQERKERHDSAQRAFGYLRDLFEESRLQRDRFQDDVDGFRPHWLFTKVLGMRVGLCDFFQDGIKHFNQHLASYITSWPPAGDDTACGNQQPNGERIAIRDGEDRGARIPTILASPERASFVRDLHTTHAAAAMFCSTFRNAEARFEKLSKAVQEEEQWTKEMEPQLRHVRSRLKEAVDVAELTPILDDSYAISGGAVAKQNSRTLRDT